MTMENEDKMLASAAKRRLDSMSTPRPGGWREERSPDGRMTMYVSPKGERLSKSEVDAKYPGKFTTVDDEKDRKWAYADFSQMNFDELEGIRDDATMPWAKRGEGSLSDITPSDTHSMILSRAQVRRENPRLAEDSDKPLRDRGISEGIDLQEMTQKRWLKNKSEINKDSRGYPFPDKKK